MWIEDSRLEIACVGDVRAAMRIIRDEEVTGEGNCEGENDDEDGAGADEQARVERGIEFVQPLNESKVSQRCVGFHLQ